jgi:hypothetical protein
MATINQGAEGEVCKAFYACARGTYGVDCTWDRADGAHECQCTTPDGPGASFVAKFAACQDIADPDFIDAQCGIDLTGDGSVPVVTLVDDAMDPAFPAPALMDCVDPVPNATDATCNWLISCAGVALTVTCPTISEVSFTPCTCFVDSVPEQAFALTPRLMGSGSCPTESAADLAAACGWAL